MTNAKRDSKVRRVIGKPKWPVHDFNAYLEELMSRAGVKNRAELSRLTGVGEQQFSQWRHGKNQPTKELLARIAPTLEVPVLALSLKAGLVDPEELDTPPSTAVLPPQIERVIDAYMAATQRRPDLTAGLLERIDYAAEWFEVASKTRPSKK